MFGCAYINLPESYRAGREMCQKQVSRTLEMDLKLCRSVCVSTLTPPTVSAFPHPTPTLQPGALALCENRCSPFSSKNRYKSN